MKGLFLHNSVIINVYTQRTLVFTSPPHITLSKKIQKDVGGKTSSFRLLEEEAKVPKAYRQLDNYYQTRDLKITLITYVMIRDRFCLLYESICGTSSK